MYHHGEMNIRAQKRGFGSFMRFLVWFSGAISLTVLALTLIFAAGVPWFLSLVVTAVIGVFTGLFVGMKAPWYFFIAGSFVLSTLIGLMIKLTMMAMQAT